MISLKKLAGMLTGISLMALAIAWSSDPKSGAIVLFAGAALVFCGSSARKVVNRPE